MDSEMTREQLASLLEQVRSGDDEAWDKLSTWAIRQFSPLASATMHVDFSRIENCQETQDIMQTVMREVHRVWKQNPKDRTFESSKKFIGNVRRRIRNRLIDIARRPSTNKTLNGLPDANEIFDNADQTTGGFSDLEGRDEHRVREEQIRVYMTLLSKEDQDYIDLCRKGLTSKQIAELKQRDVGHVNRRILAATRRLGELLRRDGIC